MPAHGKSRIIGYRFCAATWEAGDFLEGPVERYLDEQIEAGIVTQYATGRGHVVWFNGFAGPKLRAVRDEVSRLTGLPSVSRKNWLRGWYD